MTRSGGGQNHSATLKKRWRTTPRTLFGARWNAHAPLVGVNCEVYAPGSYHTNTNVRGESDIDVAAVCHDMFFYDVPAGTVPQSFGLGTASTYTFSDFRTDVHAALSARFGSRTTHLETRRSTFTRIHIASQADVTPFCEYHLYDGKLTSDSAWAYTEGVKSISATGHGFVNWHRDHYTQGVKRNTETRRRFKRIARILKNVKFDMLDSGTTSAKAAAGRIPSFLVECLGFNARDTWFNLSTHKATCAMFAPLSPISGPQPNRKAVGTTWSK